MKIKLIGDLSPEIPQVLRGKTIEVSKYQESNGACYFDYYGKDYVVYLDNYEIVEGNASSPNSKEVIVTYTLKVPTLVDALRSTSEIHSITGLLPVGIYLSDGRKVDFMPQSARMVMNGTMSEEHYIENALIEK